ncbi:glycosyltransferase family 2 protein [Bifidobacterium sp. UTBIF-78]|uniref:glycosyltransferase family 2 protein n=1 Tax=Bifidobacterium sp. UTBIF-78 TaxID=1465263 RepID=UPI00112B2945|nr:glycosyltransferase family 2 protein [Bifidobacterium sp. UTBIF-78]TPF91882.1 glycosyl hydrolase [Bifidobacterium sp. UTBIF-78]
MHEPKDKSSDKTLTVVIPCYDEQESLPTLFERMDALVQNSEKLSPKIEYTLLFIDDGSNDNTRKLIREYASQHTYVDFIFLSRNFGKEKAMYAGIEHVHTDGMVIIDADLQDPPELIPQMAELWIQGYDDVYARRRSRDGESWLKKATSRWYYELLQRVSGVAIQKDTGDFRLFDRKCIDALRRLDESERNSKALFSWIGFKKIEFLYDRDKRIAGKTKWNYIKLFHLAMDGITSFTILPLKIATWVGCLVSISAVIYALVVLIRTLVQGIDVPGYASTLIVVLVLGGVQLLSLGIIGEYLGRIFMQTKHRPNYLIQEEHLHR